VTQEVVKNLMGEDDKHHSLASGKLKQAVIYASEYVQVKCIELKNGEEES
jgi:hypothetical protein